MKFKKKKKDGFKNVPTEDPIDEVAEEPTVETEVAIPEEGEAVSGTDPLIPAEREIDEGQLLDGDAVDAAAEEKKPSKVMIYHCFDILFF